MPDLIIDADFPGGNIIVDGIDGDTVRLHQDLRDTEGDWFYWYFRVRGAQGRVLTFQFTRGNPIGGRGPCVSVDGGASWQWLGTRPTDAAFTFAVPAGNAETRFCLAVPYLEADLRRWLAARSGAQGLAVQNLCTTAKGRPVELLRLGRLDGECASRVAIVCRNHCCEMMANYSLEGLMDAVLADSEDGRWFRQRAELAIVPFMDKDGVEDGDQGKNRRPWDHNRDFGDRSIYASTKAMRDFLPAWSQGRLRIALDLHCPWLYGGENEEIYFVGGPVDAQWQRIQEFSRILEATQTSPLIHRPEFNLPFGQKWNTSAPGGPVNSFACWAAQLEGIDFGTTVEMPYANVVGKEVNAATARAFGADLARALRHYLQATCDLPGAR